MNFLADFRWSLHHHNFLWCSSINCTACRHDDHLRIALFHSQVYSVPCLDTCWALLIKFDHIMLFHFQKSLIKSTTLDYLSNLETWNKVLLYLMNSNQLIQKNFHDPLSYIYGTLALLFNKECLKFHLTHYHKWDTTSMLGPTIRDIRTYPLRGQTNLRFWQL